MIPEPRYLFVLSSVPLYFLITWKFIVIYIVVSTALTYHIRVPEILRKWVNLVSFIGSNMSGGF